MQITRLRLLGFKSFVEPSELLVERGLTGVVGPNGCGKSNLLEALRCKHLDIHDGEEITFGLGARLPQRASVGAY